MRRGKTCLFFFKQVAWMHHARLSLFVVAPLDLTALGCQRITRVAKIGGVTLVTQQRIANIFSCSFELVVWPKEGQGMVDGHHGQVFAHHFCNQTAPKTGAHDNMGGLYITTLSFDALDTAILNVQTCARIVRDYFKLAGRFGVLDYFSGDHLGPWYHQACIRIPERALNHIFFKQRHALFGLGGRDHLDPAAECAA